MLLFMIVTSAVPAIVVLFVTLAVPVVAPIAIVIITAAIPTPLGGLLRKVE